MLPNTRLQQLGQGSKSERRIAITDILLKWSLHSGSGQAAEPPAVGLPTVLLRKIII